MSDEYLWPMLAVMLITSAVWDWFRGAVRVGRFIEIDRDEGAFIVVTGLKCVLGALILMTFFSGLD